MDCRTAREWMATAVAEDLDAAETLRTHLSQCPSCQAECEELRRTWVLLAAWTDAEPPTRLDRATLVKVRAAIDGRRSWLRWLASRWVWANAATAAALAVVASLFVPYQDSLRLCGKLLADVGVPLPPLSLSFLVGFPYAFLPPLVVVLALMVLRGNGQKIQGSAIGQAFTLIMVPYIFFACGDLETMMIAGILLSTVTGALLAGRLSQWLLRHRTESVAA